MGARTHDGVVASRQSAHTVARMPRGGLAYSVRPVPTSAGSWPLRRRARAVAASS